MPIEIDIQNKKFLVPESGDPCELWVTYFNSLQKTVGSTNAKMLWLVTWKSNGNASCTTNSDFNHWLKKNGIDVSSAATRTIADISKMGSNLSGLGKNLTGLLSWGIPLTLGFLLVVIGSILWKSSKQMDIKDVAMRTPIGRSTKGALQLLRR
ncbi:hypothetical protein [Aquimarina macrocephali]|uniref:hypothetical protein n=1 Tax=Aquimarina macrocephali TaxID=666563 RepID=UPI0004666364|nr:hypothetical protein [Aquimarina macrocephali]